MRGKYIPAASARAGQPVIREVNRWRVIVVDPFNGWAACCKELLGPSDKSKKLATMSGHCHLETEGQLKAGAKNSRGRTAPAFFRACRILTLGYLPADTSTTSCLRVPRDMARRLPSGDQSISKISSEVKLVICLCWPVLSSTRQRFDTPARVTT